MKTVLVIMDFSRLSINALRYALQMNSEEPIDILHVTGEVLALSEAPLLLNWPEQEDIARQKLQSYIELYAKDIDWNRVSLHISKGDIVQSVNQWCDKNKYEYILAGTRDKYDLVDKLLGTISLGIVKTTKEPTYLIPPERKYNAYKQVRVALDNSSDLDQYCNKIIEWNQTHKAHLTLTYIRQDTEDQFLKIKEKLIKTFYENDAVDFSFDIEGINDSNITKVLMSDNSKFDLLILKSNQQSFFNSLFIKSLSKEIILNSDLPLLFLK